MKAAILHFLLLFPVAAANSLRARAGLQPEFGSGSGKLRKDFPFYHTSQEISDEVARLSKGCKGATMTAKTVRRGNVSMEDIRVRQGEPKTNRVSFIFGEHSRELISPETGLMLLKMLCGDVSSQNSLVAKTLADSEFQLILNANPISRQTVEQNGDYCLRENPDGVDLNRNWDEKWDLSAFTEGSEQFHGKEPFSEPETQAARDMILEFKPTTFLSVHSGTLGLYMPWAYDSLHMADRNRAAMLSVLQELDASHCQCPFGAAGKEVGYDCPGTSFDWVFDHLQAPFSFAWEIYGNPSQSAELRQRWEEKRAEGGVALLQEGHSLAHTTFTDLYHGLSDFVHHNLTAATATKGSEGLSQSERLACFGTFNPGTQEEFDKVVDNWATSYLELAKLTAPHVIGLAQGTEKQ